MQFELLMNTKIPYGTLQVLTERYQAPRFIYLSRVFASVVSRLFLLPRMEFDVLDHDKFNSIRTSFCVSEVFHVDELVSKASERLAIKRLHVFADRACEPPLRTLYKS